MAPRSRLLIGLLATLAVGAGTWALIVGGACSEKAHRRVPERDIRTAFAAGFERPIGGASVALRADGSVWEDLPAALNPIGGRRVGEFLESDAGRIVRRDRILDRAGVTVAVDAGAEVNWRNLERVLRCVGVRLSGDGAVELRLVGRSIVLRSSPEGAHDNFVFVQAVAGLSDRTIRVDTLGTLHPYVESIEIDLSKGASDGRLGEFRALVKRKALWARVAQIDFSRAPPDLTVRELAPIVLATVDGMEPELIWFSAVDRWVREEFDRTR